jgi:hypothetical protein
MGGTCSTPGDMINAYRLLLGGITGGGFLDYRSDYLLLKVSASWS